MSDAIRAKCLCDFAKIFNILLRARIKQVGVVLPVPVVCLHLGRWQRRRRQRHSRSQEGQDGVELARKARILSGHGLELQCRRFRVRNQYLDPLPHWRKSRDVCVAFAGVVRVSACVLCVFVVLQTPLYAVVCLV